MNRAAPLPLLLALACNANPPPPAGTTPPAAIHVDGGAGAPSLLVFSRTAAFRHDAIDSAVAALVELARRRGYSLTASEDPSNFSDSALSGYGAVVFLLTTGDVLDAEQEAAFERFIRAGKGYVGVHSASDTEYRWPWYGELVGAYFQSHSAVVPAQVRVEDGTQPATPGLPSPWTRDDEWYSFAQNPRPKVGVLLTVDEASYDPGPSAMGLDHPVAWQRTYDGGRSFYTSLGHTADSYADPTFMMHLTGGIEWGARLALTARAERSSLNARGLAPCAPARTPRIDAPQQEGDDEQRDQRRDLVDVHQRHLHADEHQHDGEADLQVAELVDQAARAGRTASAGRGSRRCST